MSTPDPEGTSALGHLSNQLENMTHTFLDLGDRSDGILAALQNTRPNIKVPTWIYILVVFNSLVSIGVVLSWFT